jgi:hypothetical protein
MKVMKRMKLMKGAVHRERGLDVCRPGIAADGWSGRRREGPYKSL